MFDEASYLSLAHDRAASPSAHKVSIKHPLNPQKDTYPAVNFLKKRVATLVKDSFK